MAMDAKSGPGGGWEQKLRDAGVRAEADLRRVVEYINDEVVPDVRRNGSAALRAAAIELHRLAARMDEHAGRTPPAEPPPAAGSPEDGTK